MNGPKRIQRKRTKGWRMPEGAVYVGRPSKWGNPWAVGDPSPWTHQPMDRAAAVEVYRYMVDNWTGRVEIRKHLAGRDLACWCPLVDAGGRPVPCNADVLLELANSAAGAS